MTRTNSPGSLTGPISKPAPNTLGTDGWWRREELVAATPGAVDVGVGKDALAQTGQTLPELAWIYGGAYPHFAPGASKVLHRGRHGQVVVYVVRRGGHLDVGTRRDFAELGWGGLCDVLDEQGGAAGRR